jgi:hypothetical protein
VQDEEEAVEEEEDSIATIAAREAGPEAVGRPFRNNSTTSNNSSSRVAAMLQHLLLLQLLRMAILRPLRIRGSDATRQLVAAVSLLHRH